MKYCGATIHAKNTLVHDARATRLPFPPTGVFLCLVFLAATGFAQPLAGPTYPLEPADTSSPRATLNSFIGACNELFDLSSAEQNSEQPSANFLPITDRILDCLDLSGLPSELRDSVGIESAIYLKEVLDRIELPTDEETPGAEEVLGTADSPGLARWSIPHTRLVVTRMESSLQNGAYLFSAETVRSASKVYSAVKDLPYRTEGKRTSPGLYLRYAAITKRRPKLSTDTLSPRGTLTLFVDSCNEVYELVRAEKHFDRSDNSILPKVNQALSCLDLSGIPEYARDYYAGEAAVCIKEVLDRVVIPPAEEIPGVENLDSGTSDDKLNRWQVPNTQLTIAKVLEGPRRGEYLFTVESVDQAVAEYHKAKSRPYRTDGRGVSEGFHEWFLSSPGNSMVAVVVDMLPDWWRHRIYEMAIWQWCGLLLAAAVGVGLILLAYRIGRVQSEQTRERGLVRYWVSILFSVVAMLIPLGFKYVIWEYVNVRGTALYVASFSADLVFMLCLIVVILSFSNRLADSVVALPMIRSKGLDATLTRIICRVSGIVVAAIVFLEGGKYLGFPITTLLASAGIGGLAIALSAQGMVKGLFGTVTVLLDKPYRVGERIIARGLDGTVEEIGLRSTKIRAFQTGHLISIPNDQMADSEIENIGKREHIRRTSDLHIPLDTPMEKVQQAVAAIRKVLENHAGLDAEHPPHVYFNDFNPDSFNIRIILWFSPPDLWDYYAFCEQVNFQIFQAFEEQGIQFSLPLRHTYWKHDDEQGPLDINLIGNSDR